MTQKRQFKQLVRERMAKTGERYAAARAQILAQAGSPAPVPAVPGLVPRYPGFGGVQGDTAALSHVLQQAGVACTEAVINGLCGGPGFLYATFEYEEVGVPLLSLALRSRSMPDTYVAAGLARTGVERKTHETASPKAARKALDEALGAGRAALCSLGMRVVAVAGRDGDDVWLDDRAPHPVRQRLADLDKARAAYRPAKHRLTTISGPPPGHDARQALAEAIADTARSYDEPAVPKSFWVNCGFRGLEKWRALLTDERDKKGWPALFGEGRAAYAGLRRVYECIEHEGTAPAGGRAFYAAFLDDAAGLLDRPRLADAARTWREAAGLWAELSSLIVDCGDAAVRRACEMADRKMELGDVAGDEAAADCAALVETQKALARECTLERSAARSLYGRMADVLGRIVDAERAAVARLG